MLLANGVDVNTQGRYHGNALQAASFSGHLELVEMSLAKGADVTDRQACLGLTTALTGHKKAQCLIRRIKHLSYYIYDACSVTADFCKQGEPYGYALQAAAFNGVNAVDREGGRQYTLWQCAVCGIVERNLEVVEMLLAKGADVFRFVF